MAAGTFAEYLSGLDEPSLTALLAARPDVLVEPVPHGFAQLAMRLGGPDSLIAAARAVSRDALAVGKTVVALGPYATERGVARVLDAPAPLVADGLAELRAKGLVWASAGVLHVPEWLTSYWTAEIGGDRPVEKIASSVRVAELATAAAAWGINPTGLRKKELITELAAELSDVRVVLAVIAKLPEPARARLEQIRRGHDFYRYGPPSQRGRTDPLGQLVAAGLLLPVDYGEELPREVAVAAWLAAEAPTLTGTPTIHRATSDETTVRPAAQAAAQEALRGVTTLLDEALAHPLQALKKGGIGAREQARLAKRLAIPEGILVVWIDLAAAAGLLGRVPTGYAPTAGYPDWRGSPPARRWAALAAAWLALDHAPTRREVDGEKVPPPLTFFTPTGSLRHTLLTGVTENGPGASVRAVGAEVDWFCPLHGLDSTELADAIAATIGEAELIGVAAADRLSELGEHLVAAAGPRDGAAGRADPEILGRRADPLLPEEHCSVIIQSDLSAVVSGQPTLAVARLLSAAAVSEARGSAGVWRFTPASIRAALDAGRTAADLLAELAALSDRPLPQPLEYLVADAARRHGQVRVRGLRSCLVADEALATEILHTRSLAKLHLSRVAPTVLSSPLELADVLARLREAGLSPVAEDATGTIIVESRPEQVAAAPTGRFVGGAKAPRQRTAAQLAQQLAADPSGAAARSTSGTRKTLAGLNRTLDEAELELLADAVDHQHDVVIAYRDRNGSRSVREIQPRQLYGAWIDGWCHLRNAQRDFTVANIESVAPTGSLR